MDFAKYYPKVEYEELLKKEYHACLKKFKKEHLEECQKETKMSEEKKQLEAQAALLSPEEVLREYIRDICKETGKGTSSMKKGKAKDEREILKEEMSLRQRQMQKAQHHKTNYVMTGEGVAAKVVPKQAERMTQSEQFFARDALRKQWNATYQETTTTNNGLSKNAVTSKKIATTVAPKKLDNLGDWDEDDFRRRHFSGGVRWKKVSGSRTSREKFRANIVRARRRILGETSSTKGRPVAAAYRGYRWRRLAPPIIVHTIRRHDYKHASHIPRLRRPSRRQ